MLQDYLDMRDIVCRDCGTEMTRDERTTLYEAGRIEFCCCQCGSTELELKVFKIPNYKMIELDASIEATERMIKELK
jgi:hypothetical protein